MCLVYTDVDSPLHEVMEFWVQLVNDGHQVIQDVLGVVHCGLHEVPTEDKSVNASGPSGPTLT